MYDETEQSERIGVYCLHCGKLLTGGDPRKKFCNSSCSASYNNRGKAKHFKHSDVCECGNPKKRQNKYCQECAEKRVYQRKTTVEEAKCEKIRRRLLIEKRGHRCERCGLSEWFDELVPLETHHIDGNTDNNTETNLILLCRNCHGITDTFRSKSKNGKRQQMRRKRYSEGKTW